MDLHIMSQSQALAHEPEKPTYAIRIYASFCLASERVGLRKTPLYVGCDEYVFDDNDTFSKVGPISLSDALAERIVGNFAKQLYLAEALLVHCQRGQNRSPAVAAALNDVFSLGNDTADLLKSYPGYNRNVYRTILAAGERGSRA